jgi:undecaprenyl-diphosphatase
MSELEALFLGLVQGLTEFLPVSSSGHLVIAQALLGIRQSGLLFEVSLHLATLASVLIVYRRRVGELVVGAVRRDAAALAYVGKLALATMPVVGAVLAFGYFFEAQFEAPEVAGACLLVTGGLLWTTRRTIHDGGAAEPGWGAAFLIGCAQVIALFPGISRSGTTVVAALALGVAPAAAAEFSFLMSVFAIGGAAVRAFPELSQVPSGELPPLLLGALIALVSGIAAIWLFVRLLRGGIFYRFAYYTWGAGAVVLFWAFLR